MDNSDKVVELESIRGLAALLVITFHMPMWNHQLSGFNLFQNAMVMVDLFFVLSGFVICSAYSHRLRKPSDVARFQFLRLGRLYPVHLLFLFAFLLIEIAKYVAEVRFSIYSPNNQAFTENNFEAFVAQLFLAHALWNGSFEKSFNSPSWSISVEFYTYLIFALVTLYTGRRRYMAYGIVAAVAVAASMSPLAAYLGTMLQCIAGFFVGCLTSLAVSCIEVELPPAFPAVSMAMLLLYMASQPPETANSLIVVILAAAIIFATLKARDGWARRLLRRPILARLGELSYSIYMSHAMVIWIASQVFRVLLRRPVEDIGGKIIPQLGLGEALLAWVLVFGVVIVISVWTYELVEKPLRNASRRFVLNHQLFMRPQQSGK